MTDRNVTPTAWDWWRVEPDHYERTVTLFQIGGDGTELVINVGELPPGEYDIVVTVKTSKPDQEEPA